MDGEWELVAQGGSGSFTEAILGRYEDRFDEGQSGQFQITFLGPLGDTVVRAIEEGLRLAGVALTNVVQQIGNVLQIDFEHRVPPLLIVAGVIGGLALLSAITGWQLFRWVIKSAGGQVAGGIIDAIQDALGVSRETATAVVGLGGLVFAMNLLGGRRRR